MALELMGCSLWKTSLTKFKWIEETSLEAIQGILRAVVFWDKKVRRDNFRPRGLSFKHTVESNKAKLAGWALLPADKLSWDKESVG